LDARDAGVIGSGVAAPVAQKGDDARFKILICHHEVVSINVPDISALKWHAVLCYRFLP